VEVIGALVGLVAVVAVGGVLVALIDLLLLPLIVLVKLLGFGAEAALSTIGWIFGGLLVAASDGAVASGDPARRDLAAVEAPGPGGAAAAAGPGGLGPRYDGPPASRGLRTAHRRLVAGELLLAPAE